MEEGEKVFRSKFRLDLVRWLVWLKRAFEAITHISEPEGKKKKKLGKDNQGVFLHQLSSKQEQEPKKEIAQKTTTTFFFVISILLFEEKGTDDEEERSNFKLSSTIACPFPHPSLPPAEFYFGANQRHVLIFCRKNEQRNVLSSTSAKFVGKKGNVKGQRRSNRRLSFFSQCTMQKNVHNIYMVVVAMS